MEKKELEILLKKYMDLVGQEEGIDFTSRINNGHNDIEFSHEESEYLKELSWQIKKNL